MGIHAHTQSTVKGMEASGSPKKSKGLVGNWKCCRIVLVSVMHFINWLKFLCMGSGTVFK